MRATYHKDGTVSVRMTRAEAHVAIWGGSGDALKAVAWNMRHALVDAEDRISEADYAAIMREVDTMPTELIPDPAAIFAEAQ